uniref:histidine kinase n=1 Tax=Roseihalotalea indica TaxID=2867963 RepID=A0AA49JIG8_9BACT|nr:PAS domain S-box protein [Tunicatimonas sp. TK19036]
MITRPHSKNELEKLSKKELIALLLSQSEGSSSITSHSLQNTDQPEKKPNTTLPPTDQIALYEQIAENFPNGTVAIIDRNGRYQFIAGKELDKIGKSPVDFIGKPIGVLPIHPETREKLYIAFSAALRGESGELEITFLSNTYLICVIPLASEHGEVTQVLSVLQNITDQKKALNEAQYQKSQLESLIENIDDAIWSIDAENRLMLGNSAFYMAIRRLYKTEIRPGQKLEEQVTQENFMRAFRDTANPQDFLTKWYQYQERALLGEKLTAEINYPFRFGDICIRTSFNPIFDANKQVIGITFYVHNITDLRKALQQAQEQEQQFKALASNIPGVVYIAAKKPACHCVYINDQVEKLTGYPTKDFLEGRMDIEQLVHPKDRKSVRQAYLEAKQKKSHYCFTYRLKHREGAYRWVEEHGTILDLKDSRIFQGVILDVTDKRKYEEKLEKQNQHLRKINAELDHFAYSVSHDLRAPLTSAMGLLSLLQLEESPQQQKEYATIINRNLQKLDAFIQDIILLSKNSRTDTEVNEINFEQLLSDILDSQKYGAEFELVHIYTQVTQQQSFYSDHRRMKIILNNLVSNALKYSFVRRDHPFARITITANEAEVCMQVQDNGIGIQEEHLPHIFDMFYRGTDRKSGSGLGLYLVKETLEKLDGRIEVESEYGEGTTFTVYVPTAPVLKPVPEA